MTGTQTANCEKCGFKHLELPLDMRFYMCGCGNNIRLRKDTAQELNDTMTPLEAMRRAYNRVMEKSGDRPLRALKGHKAALEALADNISDEMVEAMVEKVDELIDESGAGMAIYTRADFMKAALKAALLAAAEGKQMGDTVTRSIRIDVPRCKARTPPKRYRPKGGRCPYQAVVELDGDQLCQIHANQWARGEGQVFHDAEQEDQPNDPA